MKQKISKYDWDLECLLKNKPLDWWIKKWQESLDYDVKNQNHFYKSKKQFIQWLDKSLEQDKIENVLFNYVSNHANEDTTNQKWIAISQKINFIAIKYNQLLSKLTNIILKNQKTIQKYLEDKQLRKYKREFYLIFRQKPHILKEDYENLLSCLSGTINNTGDIFSTLTNSDLEFSEPVSDSKNKKHHIKNAYDLIKILETSNDRVLRKSAWICFHKTYYKHRNTLSKTLFYNFLSENKKDKVRNFKSYVDKCLFADEVSEKTLTNIYKNVESFKNLVYKFKKIRNKHLQTVLKLKNIEPWDLSFNYLTTNKISIEEAKRDILMALKPLGDKYTKIVKKAFNEHWISFMPKKGKHTGAYSIGGTYGLKKIYILMNFVGSLNSVKTLAHEIGHSVQSYLFNQKQDIYANVAIFYAEIASICNETLLFFYLLKKYQNQPKIKKYLIINFINDFFGATTRQIIFSEFEYNTANMINNDQPFTADMGLDMYLKLIKKYENLSPSQEKNLQTLPYKYSLSTIFRIDHFYMNSLYVYKYAIGQIVGLYIASRIFKKDKVVLKRYFNFLESGDSLNPLDTIALLGIDLSNKKIYDEAKQTLTKLIEQLKR